MNEFRMPSLGADMEAGTVVEWRVRPGDRIARGDVVALVETEKGLIEVEIFDTGVVESILVTPGSKVPVGTVLATIRSDGAPAPAEARAPGAPAAEGARVAPAPAEAAARAPVPAARAGEPPQPAPPPAAAVAARPRASPLARRLAEQVGIELTTIVGTGEGGAITKADVEAAAAAAQEAAPPAPQATPPAPPAAKEAVPAPEMPAEQRPPEPVVAAGAADRVAAMRKAIAASMARSKREIPHYYLGTTIDMSRAMTWLAAENAVRPVPGRLLHSVLLLRAVALATREVPEMNGFWLDGAFRAGDGVHVGVAISLRQGGLVAPAIHDVDRKPLDQIMRDLLDLVKRARGGVLRSSEVADATVTVTNLGDQGVEAVFGVIYPPQVALVGFGRVVERPWAAGGMVGVRPVITASLAADHRASDGHRGGHFLAAVDRLLQNPEQL